MSKLAHQIVPPPSGPLDVGSKGYVDSFDQAAAHGDYLHAELSADQTTPGASDPVEFDTVIDSRGSLSLDTVTNVGRVSGLKAGRTYWLCAQVTPTDSSGCRISFGWYNVTAVAYLSDIQYQSYSPSAGANSGSTPTGFYVFNPEEDTEVEVRVISVSGTPDVSGVVGTSISIVEIGAVQANVIGGLEYLDTIEVTSDVTSVLFGEGGEGALNRVLDGEVDGGYVLSYHLPDPGAAIDVQLRPNSIDPSVSGNFDGARNFGGSSQGGSTDAFWRITSSNDGYPEAGRLEIPSTKTGIERSFTATTAVGNGTSTYVNLFGGVWHDTTTPITSLQVFSATAGSIKAGARFTLWRKTTNNLRADSANCYERSVESAVEVGSATTEQTTGHTAYAGSVVGLTARIEEAVTAGTVTVNLKVDGSTTLSVELNTTDTTSKRGTANIGVHSFGPDKNVSVEIVAASYDNASSITSGITVVATLVNSALIHVPDSKDVESRLWVPPESPHSLDDEFQSTVLDASWSVNPSASASAIDAYANFASGGPRYAVHTDWRRSWLMVQPDTNVTYVHRAYTPPTNVLIWAECMTSLNNTTIANQDTYIGMGISATSAGIPDWTQDGATIWLHELDTSVVTAQFDVYEGGSQTHSVITTDTDRQGTALCYIAIHKIGTVVHGWVGTSNGNWVYMGNETYTGAAFDRVNIQCGCNAGMSPGNPISGINFIRFVETDTFLP